MQTTVGVIGCGRISESAHFPALSGMDGVRIKYACDLIPEKAADKVARFGAEQAVTDYQTVLRDPQVDAVLVLTPNFSHYTITMDALRAGKHVLCEKPITVNYERAAEMAALADQVGRKLQIGVCNRFHQSVREVHDLVQSGELGEIYHVYCSFRAKRAIPGLGGAFTTKAESGGGVLIDWGVHFLDLILYVLGGAQVKTVSADAYQKLGKDISAYQYEEMWAGPPIPDGTNDVEEFVTGYIRTDRAGISFNGAWAQNIADEEPMYVDFLGDRGGVRLIYGKHYTRMDNNLRVISTGGALPNMYEREDRAFLEAVRGGPDNEADIHRVLETQKLLDLIYRSAEQHREIVL